MTRERRPYPAHIPYRNLTSTAFQAGRAVGLLTRTPNVVFRHWRTGTRNGMTTLVLVVTVRQDSARYDLLGCVNLLGELCDGRVIVQQDLLVEQDEYSDKSYYNIHIPYEEGGIDDQD